MKKYEPIIENEYGEKLDTWIEEPKGTVKANIVMVHGFGTNKGETAGYFDDVSRALTTAGFRVIRFDFSGCGKSEGLQEDVCYTKEVQDLQTVIEYVRLTYDGVVHIFAQSMGCFVTALATPDNITKTLMTGIPNHDTQVIINSMVKRFGSRPGASIDFDGTSLLPRSTGKVQKIGSGFWRDIRKLSPLDTVAKYATKTNLLIVHWNQDEVLGTEFVREYDNLQGVRTLWLDGDHSVTNPKNRKDFLKVMLNFYNS